MFGQQFLRLLIGGVEALGAFNRRRNPYDLRVLLPRALVSRRCPSHMAASGGVADECNILAAAAHAGCQLIHQLRAKGEVVECLNVHISVHLVARLVCHHFYPRRPGLLQDVLERLRRVRNNRDRVGLLPNQFPNNVDLLLRIAVLSPDHVAVPSLLPCFMPSNHSIPVRLATVTILIFFVFPSFGPPWPRKALPANATASSKAKPATTTRFESRIHPH